MKEETMGVSPNLSTSKILTFDEFRNSLNKLINEENKRRFTSTNDLGSQINGYICGFEIVEKICKLKVSALGNNEYHVTYAPSIIECISQRQEGVFTLFYENSIQIISIKE